MAELDSTADDSAAVESDGVAGVENKGEGVQGILDSGADITSGGGGDIKETEYDEGPPTGDEPAADEPAADDSVVADGDAGGGDGDGDGTSDGDSGFFPELLNAAGLTETEATEQFGTPDALSNAIRMLDTRFVNAGSQQFASQQQQQQQQIVPKKEAKSPGGQFEMPAPPEGEEWEESTKTIFKSMAEQYSAELAKRDSDIEAQAQATLALLEQSDAATNQQYIEKFDGFVNGLGDEWAPLFGKGGGSSLAPDSMQLQNRFALDETAAQLAAGREIHGQPPLQFDELMARSAMVAFPDFNARTVEQNIEQKIVDRGNMKTARPSQRRAAQLTPTEKASQTAVDMYQKAGMTIMEEDFDDDTI